MELLVCMSIAGSIPVMICLFLYLIQRGNYNYILGRRLLLTGVFFYLVPVQLVKYLLPKDALPETMLIGRKADSYLSGTLSFWSEKQGDYIWIPQWFNIFAIMRRNFRKKHVKHLGFAASPLQDRLHSAIGHPS